MTEHHQAYYNLYAAVSQSLGAPPPTSELLLLYEATEMEMLKEGFSDDAQLKMIIVKCGGDSNRVRMQLLSNAVDSLPPIATITNFDAEFFIVNQQSNMLVDVNSSGNNLLIWGHHGGPNQRFTLRSGLLRAAHSGMVLTCISDGIVIQAPSTGAENQIWSFDSFSGAIRGYQGLCLSIDMSEGGFRQGCAVVARPFVAGAWQRFALVPSDVTPADQFTSSTSVTVGTPKHATHTTTVWPVSAASCGSGEAEAPATVPTPALNAAPWPNSYQLPLPPESTPSLQRLRSLLQRVRDECDSIPEAQRVAMTWEVSTLRSQIPSEYQPQLLEVLRLLARNSRVQAKSPRPPYFVCNSAAPTPVVTPLNEFFNDLQVPGLSTYNIIATNIACVRMPHSAVSHMDPDVLQLSRYFHPANTDVFFVVVDGRVLHDNITTQRPINIIAHRWVHETLRHGGHAASRVKMIIKSPCGVVPSSHQEFAVPFTLDGLHQTDLDVYSHENEHSPILPMSQEGAAPASPAYVRERVALYSPNNCWFHIISGSPYAFFTLCVFHGQRACICTMLVLIDFEEAFCKHVISALRSAPSLPSLHHFVHEFQLALNAVRGSFDSITSRGLALIGASSTIDSFEQADVVARSIVRFNMMKLLPANARLRVYHFAWVLKGRPQNVHNDFGRLSFFCSREIAVEYHCSSAEALECVRLAASDLLQNLDAIVSQLRSVDPLPLHLSHHNMGAAQILFQTANRVFENPLPPLRSLLYGLGQNYLDVVFHHTWRHMGYVQGDRVGEEEFLSESGSPLLKFHALVDSAMRFVYVAQHESSPRSNTAQHRINDHLANGQDELLETERTSSDQPHFLATVLASSPHLPEGDRPVVQSTVAASASAAESADTAFTTTASRIK